MVVVDVDAIVLVHGTDHNTKVNGLLLEREGVEDKEEGRERKMNERKKNENKQRERKKEGGRETTRTIKREEYRQQNTISNRRNQFRRHLCRLWGAVLDERRDQFGTVDLEASNLLVIYGRCGCRGGKM